MTYEDMLAALIEAGLIVDRATYADTFASEYEVIHATNMDSAQFAMQRIVVLPIIMAACYLGLIIYFRAKGGYRAVDLAADGRVAGEHAVNLEEALADEAQTPSE